MDGAKPHARPEVHGQSDVGWRPGGNPAGLLEEGIDYKAGGFGTDAVAAFRRIDFELVNVRDAVAYFERNLAHPGIVVAPSDEQGVVAGTGLDRDSGPNEW